MKKFRLTFLLIFVLISQTARSQDAHYWTEQFGNRSMLLSGAVIGSVDDLGAVFYNPARLALQDDPTFLISAKAYQLVKLRVKDGIAESDLSNDKFGSAPTLAAGSFDLKSVAKKIKWLKFLENHKFAYAFMSRHSYDYSLGSRYSETYDITTDWAGDEDFYSSLSWNKSYNEEWMGFTWAIPINEKWSVGISNFLVLGSQSARYSLDMQALGQGGEIASFTRNRSRSLSTTGYVGKIGLSYVLPRFSLGLTVTTPKAQFVGSGSSLYEEILAGYENSGDPDAPENILETNSTGNVDVAMKSPWAVGFGMGLKFGRHTLSASAEYYGKVDEYYVYQPEPFTGQSTGDLINNRFIDQRKAVINYGVGIEWTITDSLKAYTSFSSDYSSLVKHGQLEAGRFIDNQDNNLFTADIYNIGGGISIVMKKMDLTIGAVYSRGIQPVGQIVKFPADQSVAPDPTANETTDLIWERWRILIGFSLPFYKFGS